MTGRRRVVDQFVTADIRAELEAHIDARIEDNLTRGMSMTDAQREARRRFGPIGPVEARSSRIKQPGSAWRSFGSDLRQSWLSATRRPVLFVCGLAVAAVGLAMALATARLADNLLVRAPAGVRHPAALVSVMDSVAGRRPQMMTYPAFDAIRRSAPDAMPFVWSQRDLQVVGANDARVWPAAIVSGSYFRALETRAQSGRLIDERDDRDARSVAVISARMARTIGITDVAGEHLTVNGRPFEIVGIAERGFSGLEAGYPSDLWIPLSIEPLISTPTVFPDGRRVQGFVNTPDVGWLRGGARVPAAASRPAIEARITSAIRSAQAPGKTAHTALVTLTPWFSPYAEERVRLSSVVAPMLWTVGLTLLLASACLGSLFVGRFSDRAAEFAVRTALGGTRAGFMRMAAIELSLMLCVAAAVAAPAAAWLLTIAGNLQLAQSVRLKDAIVSGFDARAAVMLVALTAIVAALSAVAPLSLVWRISTVARVGSMRVTGGNRFRRGLLALQVAAGCALLTGALLLTQSIAALRGRELGFDAAAVTFAEVDPAGAGLDAQARDELLARVITHAWPPGIDVAFADNVPHTDANTIFLTGEGSATRQFPFNVSRVSSRYFEVLGIRMRSGRPFAPGDRGRRVAILSEPLARMYWPDGNALGQVVRVGGSAGVPHEVIGIAAGVRDSSLKGNEDPRLYLPFSADAETLTIVARGERAGPDLRTIVTRELRAIDSRLVLLRSGRLIDLAWRTIEQRILIRFVTTLIGAGSVLMVLIGVWGLAQSNLRQRWREFGIRQALGANRAHISRLALRDAIFVSLIGGAAGIAAAWQIGAVLKTWIYGVGIHDPMAIVAGLAIVVSAAFLGSIAPVRAAANISASQLLRDG
jgi:predicted permease